MRRIRLLLGFDSDATVTDKQLAADFARELAVKVGGKDIDCQVLKTNEMLVTSEVSDESVPDFEKIRAALGKIQPEELGEHLKAYIHDSMYDVNWEGFTQAEQFAIRKFLADLNAYCDAIH